MFAGWGSRVARLRWPVLLATLVAVLGAGIWGMGVFGQLTEGGYADPASESARAAEVVADEAGGPGGDVIAIYTPARGIGIDDAGLTGRIRERLAGLPSNTVTATSSYWDRKSAAYAAKDRSSAVAVISLAGADDAAKTEAFAGIADDFAVSGATVRLAGAVPLAHTSNQRSTDDLGKAELISMPIVLILLLFIFGSLVAATLPVIVGGCAVLGSLGVLNAISHGHDVNSFAVNVASLLGLGMAIDYGLFMVGRFREEQAAGHDPAEAVRRTVGTAGRTVVFSATLLMTALAGLLLFPQGFLKSLAYGGLAAVFLAMLLSLTLLPAILAILGPRVDKLPVRLPGAQRTGDGWGRLARFVLRRPVLVAIPILAGLIVLALPIGGVRFGENDERVLPAGDPARVAIETLKTSYPQFSGDGVQVVVRGPAAAAKPFAAQLAKIPGVASVGPAGAGKDLTVYNAALQSTDSFSAPARRVVDDIRALQPPPGTTVLVGGVTARNVDSLAAIGNRLPLMIGLLTGATLLLMFLAFGSVLLPIKAVVMSGLSLSATFGLLVWLFQQGHGAGLLGVTPAPLEAGIVVLMAAVVFGLSTDYEVFLLSRMVEARTRGASTAEAVTIGLSRTGRVITAAALLLIVVTGAFALSSITTMRFVGVGMITALILDATVVRMLLVPAVLALLGNAAWWAPGPLRRLQERAGLAEHDPLPAVAEPRTEVLDYTAVAAHLGAGRDAETAVIPRVRDNDETTTLPTISDDTAVLPAVRGDNEADAGPEADIDADADPEADETTTPPAIHDAETDPHAAPGDGTDPGAADAESTGPAANRTADTAVFPAVTDGETATLPAARDDATGSVAVTDTEASGLTADGDESLVVAPDETSILVWDPAAGETAPASDLTDSGDISDSGGMADSGDLVDADDAGTDTASHADTGAAFHADTGAASHVDAVPDTDAASNADIAFDAGAARDAGAASDAGAGSEAGAGSDVAAAFDGSAVSDLETGALADPSARDALSDAPDSRGLTATAKHEAASTPPPAAASAPDATSTSFSPSNSTDSRAGTTGFSAWTKSRPADAASRELAGSGAFDVTQVMPILSPHLLRSRSTTTPTPVAPESDSTQPADHPSGPSEGIPAPDPVSADPVSADPVSADSASTDAALSNPTSSEAASSDARAGDATFPGADLSGPASSRPGSSDAAFSESTGLAEPADPLDSSSLWAQVEATLAADARTAASGSAETPAAEASHQAPAPQGMAPEPREQGSETPEPAGKIISSDLMSDTGKVVTGPEPTAAAATSAAEVPAVAPIIAPETDADTTAPAADVAEMAPVTAIPAEVADAFTWMSDPRIAGIVSGGNESTETGSDFNWLTETREFPITPTSPEQPGALDFPVAKPARPATLGDLPNAPRRANPVSEDVAKAAEPQTESAVEAGSEPEGRTEPNTDPPDGPAEATPDAVPIGDVDANPGSADETATGDVAEASNDASPSVEADTDDAAEIGNETGSSVEDDVSAESPTSPKPEADAESRIEVRAPVDVGAAVDGGAVDGGAVDGGAGFDGDAGSADASGAGPAVETEMDPGSTVGSEVDAGSAAVTPADAGVGAGGQAAAGAGADSDGPGSGSAAEATVNAPGVGRRRPQTLDEWLHGSRPATTPVEVTPRVSPVDESQKRPAAVGDVAPVSAAPVSSVPMRRPQTLDEWLHGDPAQPRPQSLGDVTAGEVRPVSSAGPRPRSLGDLTAGQNRPVSSAGPRPQSLEDLAAGENRPIGSAGPRPGKATGQKPPAPARRPASLADHYPDRPRRPGSGPQQPAPESPAAPDRDNDPDPSAS
ncbi:Putative membrane protein mmpL3 [Actinoplanes sp. SE50]|uniref:MMPL family transporter n=1 Tax=unclassified Actinoplanes TaxID=2626549 RepID=UPI00023ECC8A|nr:MULTISPECIES: MMPL family transporter [unclassified Actinoplanes]AEV83774.1 Putative membrane protein mmpL3 [Actinoplanes sp. SE50/110]ATO82082.1 Putative membrane protein mmpL3 [Actinoplanes sp. SE50]SLL99489.1 Membrane protein YdfJ [Actinoplanes sp. SE50/110]